MEPFTNLKNNEYWTIGPNDSIQKVEKGQLPPKTDKIGTFCTVLLKSKDFFASADSDIAKKALLVAEKRFIHLKNKIEGKNFFQRATIHLMMWWKGQNLDATFGAFRAAALEKVNKNDYLLQIIDDPQADAQQRDAAIMEFCANIQPFDKNNREDASELELLYMSAPVLGFSPLPSTVQLYTYYKRERDWFFQRFSASKNTWYPKDNEKITAEEEERIHRLMVVTGCLGRQVLSEELDRITKQIRKSIDSNGELSKHMPLKMKEYTEKTFNAHALQGNQYLYLRWMFTSPFTLYKEIRSLKEVEWEKKFYEEGTRQNKWRNIFNAYCDELSAKADIQQIQQSESYRLLKDFKKDDSPAS
jgi:hypothetical protein